MTARSAHQYTVGICHYVYVEIKVDFSSTKEYYVEVVCSAVCPWVSVHGSGHFDVCRVFIQGCSCSSIECLSIIDSFNQTFFKHTSQDTSSTTNSKATSFTAFAKFFSNEFCYSQWSTTSTQLEYETFFNDTSLIKEFTS